MELNHLISKLASLNNFNDFKLLKEVGDELSAFVKKNEETFKFNIDEKLKQQIGTVLNHILGESSQNLNEFKCHLVVACLDIVRLISRDALSIDCFSNAKLLDSIQAIADLSSSKQIKKEADSSFVLNALKAISNLIFNSNYAQTYYSNKSIEICIKTNLKHFFNEIEFKNNEIILFNIKILFLLTTFNKELSAQLKQDFELTSCLISIIEKLMNKEETQTNFILSDADADMIIEILKLLYNLTLDIKSVRENAFQTFSTIKTPGEEFLNSKNDLDTMSETKQEEGKNILLRLVGTLRDLFACRIKSEETPFGKKQTSLHSNIINLLINMPMFCFEQLMSPSIKSSDKIEVEYFKEEQKRQINFRNDHNKKRIQRLSNGKKSQLNENDDFITLMSEGENFEYEKHNLESVAFILSFMSRNVNSYINKFSIGGYPNPDQLYPVLMLVSLIAKSNRKIRKYYRLKVLPPLKQVDVVQLPQSGLKIRNRLVKLMTDPNLQLKRLCAQFLFILCKENVSKLIKYTGYGNAAGLLAEAGLMLPNRDHKIYSSDSSDEEENAEYKKIEDKINPVTGKADLEKPKNIFEGMSEEQKEYEAMKLVNAIDKLTRLDTGLIKPATIGPDGRPIEIEHVLQLQESASSIIQKHEDYND